MFLLFNMLSRFVIAFLPKSKHLLISWLQSPSAVILEPKKIKSLFPFFPHFCHKVMGPDAIIFTFLIFSFKMALSLLRECNPVKSGSHNPSQFSLSVMSDSLRPYKPKPARLLCPWDSPGRNTGEGCHFLLQGIFLTQESNPLSLVSCIGRQVRHY